MDRRPNLPPLSTQFSFPINDDQRGRVNSMPPISPMSMTQPSHVFSFEALMSMIRPEEEKSHEESMDTSQNRHLRSVSMDSSFIDQSSNLPPPADGTQNALRKFGNVEFTASDMKKIIGNKRLENLASSDPKRLKRILANRESAARSNEKKTRYITELESKVVRLEAEANTKFSQFKALQREYIAVFNENKELRVRIQAMEEQAILVDALNEQMSAELRRLNVEILKEQS